MAGAVNLLTADSRQILLSCWTQNQSQIRHSLIPQPLGGIIKTQNSKVIAENLIQIKGGQYNEIKKALRQWIDQYTEDIPNDYIFELHRTGNETCIIKADKRLENDLFYFLVNYLKYPEKIDYIVDIEGFTIGKHKNILKELELLVYISSTDKEYDNVFVVTRDNRNFKVDFGGKIFEVNETKQYKLPDIIDLQNSEILKVNRKEIESLKEKKTLNSIHKRFKIITLIASILFALNLLIPLFPNGPELFDKTSFALYIGIGVWFFGDYEMLRIDSYFFKCLLISIGTFLYGYLFSNLLWGKEFMMLKVFSTCHLTLLFVQWPTRRIYKSLFKREPEVDKNGKFADLVYTIILFFALAILPLLIHDWVK